MIPADNISFNDDGTVWWAKNPAKQDGLTDPNSAWTFDRPCDTCEGLEGIVMGGQVYPCPDCIDGRHTFTIEVECDGPVHRSDRPCPNGCAYGALAYRVSVIPGMVLPIFHNDNAPMLDGARFIEMWDDLIAIAWINGEQFGDRITLPPAAAPGMWAVKLRTPSPENVEEPK